MEILRLGIKALIKCPGIGILVGAASGVLYSTSGLITKLLTGSVDPGTIGVVRSATVAAFGFLAGIVRHSKVLDMTKIEIAISFFHGLLVAIFTITCYYSVQMINISDVMTLVGTGPMFVIAIRAIFYRVKPSILEVLTVMLCILSTILCTQPTFIFHSELDNASNGTLGKCLALIATFSDGLIIVMFENYPSIDYFNYLAVHQGVAALLLSAFVGVSQKFVPPKDISDFVYLLSNGVVSIGSLCLYYLAVSIDSSIMASIGRTSDVATGLVYGIVVFQEVPNILSICAAILLVYKWVPYACKNSQSLHAKNSDLSTGWCGPPQACAEFSSQTLLTFTSECGCGCKLYNPPIIPFTSFEGLSTFDSKKYNMASTLDGLAMGWGICPGKENICCKYYLLRQYSSSLSAAESSTLMTTDDGTMSSSSTSNNYGVVLLQV
ncbi:hypothetical protein GQR58_004560 [Nymphon striatum]|nr:hypothetical protein GQR58_004560 [Nymphon striatum]